ncbi:hypothetical protein ASD28_22915 [Massilia sp. Root133]|uniref:hypothetical protein n=1 Tax=unclassified Massilia TaxID=2609279 RepID=UPI0006FD626B|nr:MULTISPECIES: hypothetical protein [unclassified Massilia]KQY15720.1 hypothetical protein ASD28_22915 [Massilia sp. Root133]KQZ44450.1 hypothetical protein ASD92_28280 [Massilia sp. Root1485]
MKTSGVKAMVREVLATLQAPYTEHVIDDVFHAIETNPKFLSLYHILCHDLGKNVVNNWCGQWVAHALGKIGEVQVQSRRSTLIGSYSLLDTDAATIARKPNEHESRQLMWDYYQAHKASLPADIRSHRNDIVELLIAGSSVQDAFAAVMHSDLSSAN